MLSKLFPQQADNEFSGHRLAVWVLFLISIVSFVRSLIHMFYADSGAQSIAHIPLDSFSSNGAAAVVLMLALWGSAQLLMSILYFIVLWRYRKLIPLMYLLIFCEYGLRMYLMHLKPIHTLATAPGHSADYVMLPLAAVMFIFSLSIAKR